MEGHVCVYAIGLAHSGFETLCFVFCSVSLLHNQQYPCVIRTFWRLEISI